MKNFQSFLIDGMYIEDYNSDYGKFSNGDILWVIDLDEKDSYKEIIINRSYGIEAHWTFIYRLTQNGIVEIENNISVDDLVKINKSWISPEYLADDETCNVAMGYYIYESGEFKYVDKFLTGEELLDENGNFPKGFQELEFSPNFHDKEWIAKAKCEYGYLEGKFNFISSKDFGATKDIYNSEFVIRVTEDTKWYENFYDDGFKTIPAGTIVSGVKFEKHQST
jgi:hypothetical protein